MLELSIADYKVFIATEYARLLPMTPEERKASFFASLGDLATSMLRCAVHIRAMDERGELTDEIRSLAVFPMLRFIADGKLLPQLASLVIELPDSVVRRLAGLPLADQKRLVESDTIPVLVRGTPGNPVNHQNMPWRELDRAKFNLVFGDHIREPWEQFRYWNATQPLPDIERESVIRPAVEIIKNGIRWNCRGESMIITTAQLRKYIKALES